MAMMTDFTICCLPKVGRPIWAQKTEKGVCIIFTPKYLLFSFLVRFVRQKLFAELMNDGGEFTM
ncbi:hypothetical protein FK216_15420 [Moraxellaceae bacterium AER2_44_116]|nr:hypothetical protein FK216_15420 [Moraxellaceae bacterium AER2_44_116]